MIAEIESPSLPAGDATAPRTVPERSAIPNAPKVDALELGAMPRRRRLRGIAAVAAAGALAAGGGFYAWQTWLAPSGANDWLLTAWQTWIAPNATDARDWLLRTASQTWLTPSDARDRLLTETVKRGDLEDTVTATGTLQPRAYVDVGTQVSGQLNKLHAEIGSTVKAGDLLAEIDPIVYRAKVDGNRAQLRNLRAQLAAQEARHVLAAQQLTRQQNMMKEEATTAEALQTAEATLRAAAAQIDSLKAQIQQTESQLRADKANLGYTKIFAPMAGTVVSVTAKQGQTLNASEQTPIILRIADLSTMTVNAQVSEGDVSKLREGMEVYFTTLGDSKRRWSGKLRQLLPTPRVVNNIVLYDALFDVPNPNQALMTQMTAQVFFVVAAVKDAVLVPVAALRPIEAEDEGSDKDSDKGSDKDSKKAPDPDATADPRTLFANRPALVQVVNGGGGVEPREVKVGVVTRVSAQIVSGLEPGEQVVAGTASSKSGGKKSKKKKAAAQI